MPTNTGKIFKFKLMSELSVGDSPKLHDMHVEVINVGGNKKGLRYAVRDKNGVYRGILREDELPRGINLPANTDLAELEKIKNHILEHKNIKGYVIPVNLPAPSVAAIRRPIEYAQQHVLGKVSMWDLFKPTGDLNQVVKQEEQKKIYIEFSRLFQPEFMSDSIRGILNGSGNLEPITLANSGDTAEQIMRLASKANLELGDIIVPSYEAALMVHIAAELCVKYQIGADDIQEHASEIFQILNSEHQVDIKRAIAEAHAAITHDQILTIAKELYLKEPELSADDIAERTMKVQSMGMADFITDAHRNDYFKLATLKLQTEATHKVMHQRVPTLMNEQVPGLYQTYIQDKSIDVKPRGVGRHVSILGAAGSGKSTITASILRDERTKKEQYVVIATDDYRGVYIPGTEKHEKVKTPQVFVRTQDSASLIKNVVLERLKEMQKANKAPDILIDGIKINSSMKKLIGNAHVISVNVCLSDATQVAPRAYNRAENSTGVADKGRHVETPSLIRGHARASSELLDSLPTAVETRLYDSAVKPGEVPKHCGSVDTTDPIHPSVTILDLAGFSKFLAKKYLQEDARSVADLYSDRNKDSRAYMLDTQYKADAVLGLMGSTGDNSKPYALNFMDDKGNVAVILSKQENGDYELRTENKEALHNILNDKSHEPIMKALIIRVHAMNQLNAGMRAITSFASDEASSQGSVSPISDKASSQGSVSLTRDGASLQGSVSPTKDGVSSQESVSPSSDGARLQRAAFLAASQKSGSKVTHSSDPSALTEFILGKRTAFKEAYRELIEKPKSSITVYKKQLVDLKSPGKIAEAEVTADESKDTNRAGPKNESP